MVSLLSAHDTDIDTRSVPPHAIAAVGLPFLYYLFALCIIIYLTTVSFARSPIVWAQLCAMTLFTITWLWWVRRVKTGSDVRLPACVFVGLSILVSIMGAFIYTLIVVCLSVFVIVVSVSFRAGVIYSGLFLIAVFLIHLYAGTPGPRFGAEVLNCAIILGVGLQLAMLAKKSAFYYVDRKHTLAKLQESNAQLRELLRTSRDLTLSRERGRIAAALHDGLGHRLTTVNLSLDFADRMMASDPKRAREELQFARTTVTEALDDMRVVVRALHPVQLESESFVEALTTVGTAFSNTGLDVTVTVSDSVDTLAPEVEALLLAATQEALTNISRHAHAHHVHIDLRCDGTMVDFSISDDGVGCADIVPGFGLRSLSERALELNGTVDVTGDNGFVLSLRVPKETR